MILYVKFKVINQLLKFHLRLMEKFHRYNLKSVVWRYEVIYLLQMKEKVMKMKNLNLHLKQKKRVKNRKRHQIKQEKKQKKQKKIKRPMTQVKELLQCLQLENMQENKM